MGDTNQRFQALFYGTSLIEIYTILSPLLPHLTEILHATGPPAHVTTATTTNVRITTTFLVATTMQLSAALLRLACYRTLGRVFTYELAVRKEHRLVTTGPYAVVRHPSYTALFIHFPAALLSQLGPGSWWYECTGSWRETGVAGAIVLPAFWVATLPIWYTFFLTRASREDEVMRKEFGAKWDEWTRRTPYKYVPYVW